MERGELALTTDRENQPEDVNDGFEPARQVTSFLLFSIRY